MKNREDESSISKKYTVLYLGGLPHHPKKVYNVFLSLTENSFQLKAKFAKDEDINTEILYSKVVDFEIAQRQVSTFEGLLGGLDSRQLDKANNIHITFVNQDSAKLTLRLEMITGITVMGQAIECTKLVDFIKVNKIFDLFAKQEQIDSSSESENVVSQIEKLSSLHKQGILTDKEYSSKKTELLAKL